MGECDWLEPVEGKLGGGVKPAVGSHGSPLSLLGEGIALKAGKTCLESGMIGSAIDLVIVVSKVGELKAVRSARTGRGRREIAAGRQNKTTNSEAAATKTKTIPNHGRIDCFDSRALAGR